MRVAFIGAGSVVFTRQLLRNVLAFPELADIDLALHDIDPSACTSPKPRQAERALRNPVIGRKNYYGS